VGACARIVAGFCVPHTPYFTVTLPENPESPDARCYERLREHLAELRPDVIVAFDCDHLNTFFLDNLPTFAVAAVDRFGGPNDDPPGLEHRVVPSHHGLGRAIHSGGVEAGFDLALVEKLDVDHSLMVPLHFLTPEHDVPVVPIFVNGLVPPIPTAARAHALGRTVGEIVRAYPEDLRVAVMASGSINLEVGGPRAKEGEVWGTPDPAWMRHVVARLWAGAMDRLVEDATREKLASVGNVAGELLCLVAMLGAIGDRPPAFLEPQPALGHAFGAWRSEDIA
jgi:aromatic ring-opening dioxygenase catalytic subunit (LigB family)